jgi:fructan beta-fructosidase
MVYYQGEYHLFYQYHPDSMVWGPMHWGHAVSKDLLHWEHLPIALYPDEWGMIYSGSAVIDYTNTADFGPEAMVTIFTHHNPKDETQSQSLAYSLDNGRTWHKYAGNPVLSAPEGSVDFRDPKVFWYTKADGVGHWVMCLATGYAIRFYTSPNLREWTLSGRFGDGYGSRAGVWETPELFKLPARNSSREYWVLSVGVLEGGPGGGSGTQYFVGDFDGQTFTVSYDKDVVHWADYGADFYAVQSWTNMPDGRRLWLAWMNNWQYGKEIPTVGWRGAMTIPREVGLVETAAGPRLIQQPARELEALRTSKEERHSFTVRSDTPYSPVFQGESYEIFVEFEVPAEMMAECFGVRVRVKDKQYTVVGYWPHRKMVFVDRCISGQINFFEGFGRVTGTILQPENETICLHLFVDRCSLEVFAGDGQVCFTELIFPEPNSSGIELFAVGGPISVREFVVYSL